MRTKHPPPPPGCVPTADRASDPICSCPSLPLPLPAVEFPRDAGAAARMALMGGVLLNDYLLWEKTGNEGDSGGPDASSW